MCITLPMRQVAFDEASMRRRAQHLETELLEALATGDDHLEDFLQHWSDFRQIFVAGNWSQNTVAMVQRIAANIAGVAESFLELEEFAEVSRQQIEAATTGVLEKLHNNTPDYNSPHQKVCLAAKWLGQNFHNPYPHPDVRSEISRKARWARKDVDSWFVEARQKIGWTQIRKNFFGGKRATTVHAATDYFLGSRGSSGVPPSLELALQKMHLRVQELYLEPFTESMIARSLDSAVKSHLSETASDFDNGSVLVKPPYPSPEKSPLPPNFAQLITTSSSDVPTLKRARSEDEPDAIHTRKRVRLQGTTPQSSAPSGLPSPAPSDSAERSFQSAHKLLSPSRSPSPIVVTKKGRRLSGSHVLERPNCSSTIPRVVNRLHTLSDPIPTRKKTTVPSPVPEPDASQSVPEINETDLEQLAQTTDREATSSTLQIHAGTPTAHQPQFELLPGLSFSMPEPLSCNELSPTETYDLSLFNYELMNSFGSINACMTDNVPVPPVPLAENLGLLNPIFLNMDEPELHIDFSDLLDWNHVTEPNLISFDGFTPNIDPSNVIPSSVGVVDDAKACREAEIAVLKQAHDDIAQRIYLLEQSNFA